MCLLIYPVILDWYEMSPELKTKNRRKLKKYFCEKQMMYNVWPPIVSRLQQMLNYVSADGVCLCVRGTPL